MNTNRFLLSGLFGGIAYFFAGYLMYVVLFSTILTNNCPGIHAVQRDADMLALGYGNLVAGFLLAYVFERWNSIRSWLSGAVAGATIGGLIALGYDTMMHGTTNLMSWGCVLTDTLVYALISAIAGAVIGWWQGYNSSRD